MKHFLNTQDWTRPELDALLGQAAAFKRTKSGDQLKGRAIALVFFNPSLRTRTSFEIGAFQLPGETFDVAVTNALLGQTALDVVVDHLGQTAELLLDRLSLAYQDFEHPVLGALGQDEIMAANLR